VLAEDSEMDAVARNESLETMRPELGTRPRVYYRNLWRYSKCFIGGTVSVALSGLVDCLEGAKVRLLKSGICVAESTTDNYGDFKFDRLDENSGAYLVEITTAAGVKKSIDVDLGASINIGEIRF
jgi:hypothetical protein